MTISTSDFPIRVFVSSTFRDMQAERDHLVKKIFPHLRRLCEERAVTFTEVDLRWGITTDEAADGMVLPLCLAEIQRCRPYFIGLLGERYGWMPEEKEIPADLLETQPWLKEHRDCSVTELEIHHGVLGVPGMSDHALFYFRDPSYLDRLPAGSTLSDFISESPASAAKLARLKNRIRAESKAKRLLHAPRENYPDPEKLGAMLLADLTAIIEKSYPKDQVPDPIDQEAMRHNAYAQGRRRGFVERTDLLLKIDDHVCATAIARPLVLTGDSGCGKSALLAEWVDRWRKSHAEDLVIQHFVGSTGESADWQGLVSRILVEIRRAYAIPDELPTQPSALRAALTDWLAKTVGRVHSAAGRVKVPGAPPAHERRLILVLDALNQLSSDDPSARQLGWLPAVFPHHVRVLVSALPGESLDVIRRRSWPELAVPLFAREEIGLAAKAYLRIFGKRLPKEILAMLADAPPACNPLYLRAVLDELRQFGPHDDLPKRAAWYLAAPDLTELFSRILTRWHEDFGQEKEHPDLVQRSLSCIACSRFGISESEMLALLGKKNAQEEDQPLPRLYWTPLYLAAEHALAQCSGLLTFGHDFLRKAVEARFLPSMDDWDDVRLHMADWFEANPWSTDRKLDELPTLLVKTESFQRLKRLLANMPMLLLMRSHQRRKWELHGYWLALEGSCDPVAAYRVALSEFECSMPDAVVLTSIRAVADFHYDAGRYREAERLSRRLLVALEKSAGLEHSNTLSSLNDLARILGEPRRLRGRGAVDPPGAGGRRAASGS